MSLSSKPTRTDLIDFERQHVWPPYTSSEEHEQREPLVIVSAEGLWIEDANGRRYMDANASWWTCTLGHRHPRILKVIRDQAESLLHVSSGGITHPPVAQLAKELAEIAPEGLTRTHFSDDGSTSVEVAIKTAFQYWQQNGRPNRHRFIALAGAYHGDTIGAASLAALDEFHHVFEPLLFEVIRPPNPNSPDDWQRAVERIEHELKTRADEIAGVVVEPLVQGASGMRMYAPELLRRIRAATQAVDTFLIADEVFVGYGRTGRMWACNHADITPDLLCLGKGFTAGTLPMAATMATARIYDGFRGDATRALMHGHTFCGNPLGAAVAREVLAIYRDENVVASMQPAMTILHDAFDRIGTIPGVRNVRKLGMISAVDLGEGGYYGPRGWRVFDEALARGAFLRPLGDTVYLTPPLNIEPAEMTQLVTIVEESIRIVMAD